MSTHIFEAPTIGLGRILSEGSRYLVPHHQRDYSWGEDEVTQLFLDIEEARLSDSDYYFLGLMVFIPAETGDYTILDGQQRMATSLIILSAIRTWLRGFGFDRDADQIQSTFIARRELGEDELYPRLILNEVNNHSFYSYVINEMPISSMHEALAKLKKYDPNRTLLESIIFCREEVHRIASLAGDPKMGAQRLFEIVNFLRDNVRVVRITVPSEADAYTVFETLNDRGLDLTVLDLVKNYIFGKAGKSRLGEIKNRWTQMIATLINVRGDDFLKVYWTSRNGRTQKTQLFQYIKNSFKNSVSVAQFSVDLLGASEHFAAIELADDPIWESFTDKTKERIRTLKMLRSQSIHPVILSGLSKFNHREMERLIWLLEVLIVRYQLIGGGRTGIIEIGAAKLAAEIYNGKIKSATEAFKSIGDLYPNDNEFREAFILKQERNNTKAQYLLKNLEEEERKRNLDEKTGIELTPKALTVEHIFPKGSGPEWSELEKKDPFFMEDCTYRLGNLTLLGDVNRELGQKGFSEKVKTYEKSSLLLTKSIAEFKLWNREAVDKRQIAMANLAVTTWRFN